MPSIIINGTKAPFRTSRKESFDPSRGVTYTETWKSAGAGVGDMTADCIARGQQYDLELSDRISTITITTQTQGGSNDLAIDQWQMLTNEINLDVYESAAAVALGHAAIAKIKIAVNALEQDGTVTNTDAWSSNEIALFNLVVRGSQFFPVGRHILRHTTNAWSGYANNVSSQRVGEIYSNFDLGNEIGTFYHYWTYPAPARIQTLVSNSATGISDDGLLRWGWRKLPSNETTAPNNRIEITTEYWHAQYPYLLYP